MSYYPKAPIISDGVLYWRCGKCKKLKLPADYFKVKTRLNGLSNSCKSCEAKRKTKWYRANKESKKAYNAIYKRSENGRRAKVNWDKNNPIKVEAHSAVGYAKKTGKLIAQPCEVCGSRKNIHAHHDDYEKPLEVRWLCRTHHNEYHQLGVTQ